MSVPVRRALFARLGNDSQLTNLLGTPAPGYQRAIYHQVAPPKSSYPFILVHKQAGTPQYALQGLAFDNELWTVKAVDRDTTSDAVDTINARIDFLLTDHALNIAGRALMGIWRESDVDYLDTSGDEQYRHAGAMYRLIFE